MVSISGFVGEGNTKQREGERWIESIHSYRVDGKSSFVNSIRNETSNNSLTFTFMARYVYIHSPINSLALRVTSLHSMKTLPERFELPPHSLSVLLFQVIRLSRGLGVNSSTWK
jgi:hypothetical protein